MRKLQFKFPSQIRISGWDFGSSARAMNQAGGKGLLMTYESVSKTQADLEKVSRSTTERKIMSTKTSIKRIALVAVAGLGLGLVTSVTANADQTAAAGTVTAINLKAATANTNVIGDTQTIYFGATATAGEVDSGETTFFRAATTGYPAGGYISASGAATAGSLTWDTVTTSDSGSGAKVTLTNGASNGDDSALTATATGTNGLGSFTIAPTKAGTYEVTVWNDVDDDGVIDLTEARQTITFVAKAASALSVSQSTRYHGSGTDTPTATTDAVPVSKSSTLATNAGNIQITLKREDGTAYGDTTSTAYAYVSGSGYVDMTATDTDYDGTSSAVRSDSLAVPSDGIFNVNVTADGTVGTGTVYIYVLDAAGTKYDLGSEVFSFYGTAASLTATQGIKYIRTVTTSAGVSGYTGTAPGAYDTYAMLVKAKDSSGNLVGGLAGSLSCVSNTPAVIAGCTITADDGTSLYSNGVGSYYVQITTAANATSGQTGSLYVRMVDPADSTKYLVTDSITFTVSSKTAKTTTLTLDKSDYAPGEKMVLTVKSLDSAGNPVADTWGLTTFRGCVGSDVVSNKSLVGSLPTALAAADGATGCYLTNGEETYKLFAPTAEGEFIISTVSPYDGVTPIEVKATVTSSTGTSSALDAANEATDAANAATDAANAAAEAADAATAAAQDAQAAVAALATQVSSLIAGIKAQITSLTNLVIKIQKKVKA